MTSTLRRALNGVGWWTTMTTAGPARYLALNALVDAAGTGVAAVCLPFYAVRAGGLSTVQLGLVLSVSGICELVAAVPNGAAAGRFGVRGFSMFTKLVLGLCYAALALSHGTVALLVLTAAAGVARAGASGLNQSLTVAVLGEEERGAVLGSVRALRNVGYLASGALGALVLALGGTTGLRLALAANAVSFLLGIMWTARLRPQRAATLPDRTDWSVLRDYEYLLLIVCAAVFGSSLVVLDVGLPLWVLSHPYVPAWTSAAFVVINTMLVVLFQVRFAKRIDTVPRAVRAIRLSSLAFLSMGVLLALTSSEARAVAILLVALAAAALTLGELQESPAWWTLSMSLARPGRTSEYLAAFDLSWALVGIAGPAAMAAVVSAGSVGWLVYGALLPVAGLAGTALAGRRAAHLAVTARKEAERRDEVVA
jgi:hypothetical protein